MIPLAVLPNVRRAILDLLADIGGEHNDEHITALLVDLGHRVARRDVAAELSWLAGQSLVLAENVGPYLVAEITPDGLDCAAGRLVINGVHRHKSGR